MRSNVYKAWLRAAAALMLSAALILSGLFGLYPDNCAAAADIRGDGSGAATLREGSADIEVVLGSFFGEPVNVRLKFVPGESSPNAILVTFEKSEAMAAWLAQDEETRKALLDGLGYEDCVFFAQIDWALDDPEKWHYNTVWDTETGRANVDTEHPDEFVLGDWAYVNCAVTSNSSDMMTIFQMMGNVDDEKDVHWNDGKRGEYSKGWVSVLKESQYTVMSATAIANRNNANNGADNGNGTDDGNTADNDADSGNGADNGNAGNDTDNGNGNGDNGDDDQGPHYAVIDYENHTVYVRVRFGVKLTKKDAPANGNTGDGTDENKDADQGNGTDDGNDGNNTDNNNNNDGNNTDNGNGDNGNGDNGNGDNGNGDNGNTGDTDSKIVYVFSDWSRTTAYGALASNPMFHLDELFAAPEISNVMFIGKDVSGYGPYFVYTLTASDETVEAALSIEAEGGFARIFAEARRVGDTEWVELTGDEAIQNGENKVELSALGWGEDAAEDAKDIEIRTLYCIFGADRSEYDSKFSETVTFAPVVGRGSDEPSQPDASVTPAATPTSSADLKALLSETVEKKKDDHCKLCGVCPVQPLGICLFVWVGGIILILALIIFFSRKSEDRKRRRARRRRQ